ncbi:MAG: hypothetical protein MZV65_54465 [Chromatiales bacterium]|nr:hypothetical protein [Chromatiales bacterium]
MLEELGALAGFAGRCRGAAGAMRRPRLDDAQAKLLELIGHDPVDIDTLVERSGLTAAVLSSMLLTMELRGLIEARPGGKVQRTS